MDRVTLKIFATVYPRCKSLGLIEASSIRGLLFSGSNVSEV